MMEKIEVCRVAEYLPIGEIKFHPQNAEIRTISRERLDDLKASIVKKGFYEPILVWKKEGVVLAGEHRTRAAQELLAEGFEFVSPDKKNQLPVVYEDCDPDTAREILHESNNHYAHYIDEKLSKALQEAKEAGHNLQQMGYSKDDIDRILSSAIDDAEEVIGEIEEENLDGSRQSNLDVEKYETLTLPKDVHDQLVGILTRLARATCPEWAEGDSLVEATQVLCQLIHESKVLENAGN